MAENRVTHALCIGVNLPELPGVLQLAADHPNIYASVGVHPDYEDTPEPSIDTLTELSRRDKVVAIGETGLDYFRVSGDLEWQRTRFRTHIRAARECGKPLVIHTRSAAADTLAIMREERAGEAGGVMHCFTESWRVPLNRMLIETDSPYLAPVPFRGKLNEPAYVRYVAEEIARLRDISVEEVAAATSTNFFRLFGVSDHAH